MKKLLFIVNNRAGKTRSRSPLYDAIACFSRSGYLVSVHETQAPATRRRPSMTTARSST